MDALCRQFDIPNMYNGQFHNTTKRENEHTPNAQEQDGATNIDDDTLGLIKESNQLDQMVYERALALALGSRDHVRTIRCVPGPVPACRVRNGFADAWVENKAGGFILFGPYVRLIPGRYAVIFHLRRRSSATDDWSGPSLGHLDVIARKGEIVLARHQLPNALSSIETNEELTFEVTYVMSDAEFRVAAAPGAPFDVETTVVLRQL